MASASELTAMKDRLEKLKAIEKRQAGGTGGGTRGERSDATTRRRAALGGPFPRKGESVMNSRPYSYVKAMAYKAELIGPEEAKHEIEWSQKINKSLRGTAWRSSDPRGITAPLSAEFFEAADSDARFHMHDGDISTLKSMLKGQGDWDQDEADYLSRKSGVQLTRRAAANQSYLQQQYGGAMVPYPEMGPLIPLLRNTNALLTAGASVMPLPPSGRLSFPRMTGPTLGYAVGEGQAITQSNVTTDQLTLQAKKIGALLTYNNELLRYGGPIVEQAFRNDMTITLALTLDWFCLQGQGSDTQVAGLINYPGVINYAAGVQGANGNQITPADPYQMVAQVLANNGKFTGWILRPELMAAFLSKRVNQLSPGDQQGLFLFNLLRGFDKTRGDETWFLVNKPTTETPQVPLNRTKGTSSNLTTLFGGWWEDYYLGLYGTIEFATATQGTPYFAQDQSQCRAVLAGDGGPRHPGCFIYADQISATSVGQ